MNTNGGWMSVSQAARLYGKSRKWVDNQIQAFGITTKKEGNKKLVQMASLIAHRGEPPKSADKNSATHADNSQNVTPDVTHQTELLNQEILFLRKRITDLETDKADWKEERLRLQAIIKRQTFALPAPDEHRGVFDRFMQWVQSR